MFNSVRQTSARFKLNLSSRTLEWRKSHLSYRSHLKTKKVSLCEKKNAVYYIQISTFVPEIFKFLKYANYSVMTSYTQPIFIKYISANLYQKFLILCSKILLNVLHNMRATALLPWQHTGFQTSPKLKTLVFHFDISNWCLISLIQQVYKNFSSRLWPHLIFCELKITDILKSSEWGLEKSELPCHFT